MRSRRVLAGVGLAVLALLAAALLLIADRVRPPSSLPSGATLVASYERPRASDVVAGFGSIWVSTGPGDTLVRIDPDTGKAIDLITFPYSASVLAVGPDSIWISSFDGNKVSRIDPATDKVTGTVDPGGEGVVGLLFAGGYVWAANHDDVPVGSVAKIEPSTMRVIDKIPVGDGPSSGPTWIAYGAGSLWVGVNNIGSVVRIDPATDKILATIPVRGACGEIAANDAAVWVGSACAPGLARIDPATNRVTTRLGLPGYIPAVALDGSTVWFGSMEGYLGRVDAAAGRIVGRTFIHGPAFGAATGFGFVWLTDRDNGMLYKFRPD